jgi:membrane protease YdiL (CAAX protease family)
MKKCTYCGKEYFDDVAQCVIDGAVLQIEEPPPPIITETSNPPPATSSLAPRMLSDRRLRIFELALVCVIAFGGSIWASAFHFFGGQRQVGHSFSEWIYAFICEGSALGLLWYVLLRRSKSIADLGFRWRWTDIGWSIALWAAGYVAFFFVYQVIYYSGLTHVSGGTADTQVTQSLFGKGVFATTLLFLCLNPFFEELIVRAYVITEIRALTNSPAKAIIFSAVLQMSYHLYQGVPMTIGEGAQFLIWSIYFAKTGRITPIILAHLYEDVGGTLWYLFHNQVATSVVT